MKTQRLEWRGGQVLAKTCALQKHEQKNGAVRHDTFFFVRTRVDSVLSRREEFWFDVLHLLVQTLCQVKSSCYGFFLLVPQFQWLSFEGAL